MGTTRFGVRYAELGDAPDALVLGRTLAEDVDTRLFRLYRVAAGENRPTGVPLDFLIWDENVAGAFRWDGAAWQPLGGSGSSGGGGSGSSSAGVWAGWQASSAQSIPSGADTVVSFGQALGGSDSAAVTRQASGAGHQFRLEQGRLWTITATVRFEQNGSGGRLVSLVTSTGSVLAKFGGEASASTPWTVTLAKGRRLAAGTTVRVIARHNAGASLPLEREDGSSVSIDFVGV